MTPELIEYRITELESNFAKVTKDTAEIKEMIQTLTIRLGGVPTNGLQCPLHQIRMDEFKLRIERVEEINESINHKVIYWSAGAAIILFLLTQLIVPFAYDKIFDNSSEQHKAEYVVPATNQFGNYHIKDTLLNK